MTQPRAVEPVLGGGRFSGLRARGSPGACLALSNSPTARFTLCHPTAHSWFTPSPRAETLVTPTGHPPRSARFWEQGLCVPGYRGWSQALLSCPSLLDPGRHRGSEQLGSLWSLLWAPGHSWSLVVEVGRHGCRWRHWRGLGRMRGAPYKEKGPPSAGLANAEPWTSSGAGENSRGGTARAAGRHQCIFIKDYCLLAKHADPIVHHLNSCEVPSSAALSSFTGGPPAPPSIFRMLSLALMETVPTKR